jgi:hypothetical protein
MSEEVVHRSVPLSVPTVARGRGQRVRATRSSCADGRALAGRPCGTSLATTRNANNRPRSFHRQAERRLRAAGPDSDRVAHVRSHVARRAPRPAPPRKRVHRRPAHPRHSHRPRPSRPAERPARARPAADCARRALGAGLVCARGIEAQWRSRYAHGSRIRRQRGRGRSARGSSGCSSPPDPRDAGDGGARRAEDRVARRTRMRSARPCRAPGQLAQTTTRDLLLVCRRHIG